MLSATKRPTADRPDGLYVNKTCQILYQVVDHNYRRIGWMYDSLYFRTDHPGIALHGSASNTLVKTYPASHGCVRVWRPDIQQIFAETPIGTIVMVYGRY